MSSPAISGSGLTDKVAIVTGGSGGIGRSIVQVLAAAGMEVVFTYRGNAASVVEIAAANPGAKISGEGVGIRHSAACTAFAEKIPVNAVAAGVIETEGSRTVRERAADQVLSRILLRRIGCPEGIAHAVWFLASTFADYFTGEILHVDGGLKME